jgi:uncharacterized membrane protein YfhO
MITVETSARERQVLATTESFDSGWMATAGDRSVPIVRVNGDFLGCVVEPGKQVIRLEFRPRARRVGAGLALVGLGFLSVAGCLSAVDSRRRCAAKGETCVRN